MAYVVMAYVVMAYIIMAHTRVDTEDARVAATKASAQHLWKGKMALVWPLAL